MSTLLSLDYGELFELDDPLADRPLRLTTEEDSDWLSREQAVDLFGGELELQFPLKLKCYMGGASHGLPVEWSHAIGGHFAAGGRTSGTTQIHRLDNVPRGDLWPQRRTSAGLLRFCDHRPGRQTRPQSKHDRYQTGSDTQRQALSSVQGPLLRREPMGWQ